MILKKKKVYGFIKKDTIQKYITKNNTYTKKIKSNNIKNSIICIVVFCAIAFLLHMYNLYCAHKKKNTHSYLSIIPRSGIY